MRIVSAGAVALMLLSTSLVSAPARAADATAFTKSCSGSQALAAMFATKAGDRAQADTTALCTCIASAVAPKATDDQLVLLAANVTGSMTPAQTDAYNNDDATQEMAMNAMNGCLESTGVAKDYGG